LRAGTPPDEQHSRAGAAVPRTGGGLPAGARLRTDRVERDARWPPDPFHGLPWDLRRGAGDLPDRLAGTCGPGLLAAGTGIPLQRALAERRSSCLANRSSRAVAF